MATLALPTAKRPSPLALPGAASGSAPPPPPPAPARRPSAPSTSAAAAAASATAAALLAPPAPAPAQTQTPPALAPLPAKAERAERASASPSPEAEAEDEGEGEGDDDDDEGGGAKAKKGRRRKGPAVAAGEGKTEYRYSSEIAQMDPLPETIRLVEDIVRGQVIEIVTRARLLTHLRSARYLSAEDLIFLIRDDRGKVNRLRTYLSWKDVRKRAKEDEEGGDVDVDEADKNAAKGRKPVVKLPWELLTPFSDFLQTLPSQRADDDDDEDEDEMQAYQDSMQRLRDADEITKKMTKDEYVHYSDCRQASFTYRKARRFRDFINFGAYLDVRPNDDIVDILGFLAFEMVRSLCVTALDVRAQLARSAPAAAPSPTKRKAAGTDDEAGAGGAAGVGGAGGAGGAGKRARTDGGEASSPDSGDRAERARGASGAAGPSGAGAASGAAGAAGVAGAAGETGATGATGATSAAAQDAPAPATAAAAAAPSRSLFAPPPSARQPLLPSHVLEAFAQIQRKEAAGRVGGMRSWRGGLTRGRVALI